ncbi:putative hydrolase [Mariannaea sp. PMI_226]|nr:putative hydrolase [Mariannaea sp. PMI_226]
MVDKSKFELINVRVFDGNRISSTDRVIIDGDIIGTDPMGATVIDCQGGILLPGLIDCHVHCRRPENLKQFAHWGVTTALDMGSWPQDLRQEIRQHALDHHLTEVWTAGIPATTPGSGHSRIPGLPEEALLANTEQAAVGFVADRIADDSSYIKVIADIPGPSHELLSALTKAAHKHGRYIVAHATTSATYAMAQEAGIDLLTHAPLDAPLAHAAVAKFAVDARVMIPTLRMMQGLARAGQNHGRDYSYANARDSVSALHSAGVAIFAGTDANSGPESPVPHGEGIHSELELLVDAGLSNVEALRAATVEPAKYFKMTDRGAIEPGRRADLVLLAKDPIQDICATRSIRRVWCRGVELRR